MERPPRRIPLNLTHTWDSQVVQYDRPDIIKAPGVNHWTVPSTEVPVPVECLLFFDFHLRLVGILNYFPEGSPFGDSPHDAFLIVHPLFRRRGIGSELLRTAITMWPQLNPLTQAYTDEGWALAQSILRPVEHP